jgi:uncharacterized protein YukE
MIAQGWGGAAGKAGNTEWQAAIVDVKHACNMLENVSKNVNTGANVNATMDATVDETMDATINANMSIL